MKYTRTHPPAPCPDCHNEITPRGGRCVECNKVQKKAEYRGKIDQRLADAKIRRDAWHERYKSFIKEIKETNPCADCSKYYPHYIMDFHHLDGDKKERTIAKMAWLTLDKVAAEIEKCVVLCANCHRERTYQERWKLGIRNTKRVRR